MTARSKSEWITFIELADKSTRAKKYAEFFAGDITSNSPQPQIGQMLSYLKGHKLLVPQFAAKVKDVQVKPIVEKYIIEPFAPPQKPEHDRKRIRRGLAVLYVNGYLAPHFMKYIVATSEGKNPNWPPSNGNSTDIKESIEDDLITNHSENNVETMNHPLNQILYRSPGPPIVDDRVGEMRRLDDLVRLLRQVPDGAWAAAVNQTPSCRFLRPLSQVWPFGRFAVLYLMGGLNNYQLKGRAEDAYWPKILPLIEQAAIPQYPHELRETLKPFYRTERLSTVKLNRLDRFLGSPLCSRIWDSDPEILSNNFLVIWPELSRTMKQAREKKTIVFGMKCLAYALLLVNKTGFDFRPIPIPVDSRVRELSRRLHLVDKGDAQERGRWNYVIDNIRISNPGVTMLHLDSVLWQIGTLSKLQIKTHLLRLGFQADLTEDIVELFD